MTVRSKVLVALAGAAIVVGACSDRHPVRVGCDRSGGGPDGALVKRSDIKIEIVTHGQAQDGFWGVVRNGVKAGASTDGRDGELQRSGRRERHARHGLAHRRRGRQEADRPRRLDPEPGRPRPGHQEGRRRGHPGRLDELRL